MLAWQTMQQALEVLEREAGHGLCLFRPHHQGPAITNMPFKTQLQYPAALCIQCGTYMALFNDLQGEDLQDRSSRCGIYPLRLL